MYNADLSDVFSHILEPHTSPLPAAQLFKPGRIIAWLGIPREGGTIIHLAEISEHKEQRLICAVLCLVCKSFERAVTLWMLHVLWFTHLWEIARFLDSWHLRACALRAVCRLCVNIPLQHECNDIARVRKT
jgi:hypothetical protein